MATSQRAMMVAEPATKSGDQRQGLHRQLRQIMPASGEGFRRGDEQPQPAASAEGLAGGDRRQLHKERRRPWGSGMKTATSLRTAKRGFPTRLRIAATSGGGCTGSGGRGRCKRRLRRQRQQSATASEAAKADSTASRGRGDDSQRQQTVRLGERFQQARQRSKRVAGRGF
ncbi:hypothetical protein Syun_016591 [Stephania yunnanensis]|uniref:Uncharacterized protein n=1 Tax=Stephania yunnanensis TaxID=152371 RepID=A0AAP0P2L5_9MAGN